MPILDLSLVTQALATLIQTRVTTGLKKLGQSTAGLKVSLLPTDKLTGDRTIGLYLYHAMESAYSKNLPVASSDVPPIAFTSMGVDLFYQLTAHADPVNDTSAGESAAGRAQLLFGLALKSMHDIASIDHTTIVDGTPIFPNAWPDNADRIRISLQPISEKDSVHYWTAGAQPLRLAAYYQISATLLEPESPAIYSGRVLRYGVQTLISGAPWLDAARSIVTFRVPGETTNRQVEVQPAEATVGQQIIFYGTDLGGSQTSLLIQGPPLTSPVEVDSEWSVSSAGDRVFATVNGFAQSTALLPGIYTATVKVDQQVATPGGSPQDLVQTSNSVPFIVTPNITTPSATATAGADAQGIVVVQGWIFNDPDLAAGSIQVLVGPGELSLQTGAGGLTAGNFEVVDGTTLVPPVVLDNAARPFVIRFRFPITGLNSGDSVPLRIVINGAENAPRWVTVP